MLIAKRGCSAFAIVLQGRYIYLVRWQGYTDKDNSWVPRDVRRWALLTCTVPCLRAWHVRACAHCLCDVVSQHFVDKRLAKEYDEMMLSAKRAQKRKRE